MRAAEIAEVLQHHAEHYSPARGVERCVCGESKVGEPYWHRAHVAEQIARLAAAERDGGLQQRIEALIGPRNMVFLSDAPNKLVRLTHRDRRLGCNITESFVRAADVRAALDHTGSNDG